MVEIHASAVGLVGLIPEDLLEMGEGFQRGFGHRGPPEPGSDVERSRLADLFEEVAGGGLVAGLDFGHGALQRIRLMFFRQSRSFGHHEYSLGGVYHCGALPRSWLSTRQM